MFEISKTSAGYARTPTNLTVFTDLGSPHAGLVSLGGSLFGTTAFGGPAGNGTVFDIPKTSTGYAPAITLYSFCPRGGSCPEWPYPLPLWHRLRKHSPRRPAVASFTRKSGSDEPLRACQLGHRPVALDRCQRHLGLNLNANLNAPLFLACLLHILLPHHRRFLRPL